MKAVWNNVEKHLSRIVFQKVQASAQVVGGPNPHHPGLEILPIALELLGNLGF